MGFFGGDDPARTLQRAKVFDLLSAAGAKALDVAFVLETSEQTAREYLDELASFGFVRVTTLIDERGASDIFVLLDEGRDYYRKQLKAWLDAGIDDPIQRVWAERHVPEEPAESAEGEAELPAEVDADPFAPLTWSQPIGEPAEEAVGAADPDAASDTDEATE